MPLDLLEVAQTEREGDQAALFELLDGYFDRVDDSVRPEGYNSATIWTTGNYDHGVMPVTHAITDQFSLVGALAAIETVGLPANLVPAMAQFRHGQKLSPLAWFGNMGGVTIKWSTAGDVKVHDGAGGKCPVMGKSGNAKLRTEAGVYCNVRDLEVAPGRFIQNVRAMPMMPYSQNKSAFSVDEGGVVHSEINTPGDRMAYACRTFLELVNELSIKKGSPGLGRTAIKPTQAQEDTVFAGLLVWMLQHTKCSVKKAYSSDPYEEQKENIDRIVATLPADFLTGMDQWTGNIYMHIADANYGLLLDDMLDQDAMVVLSTDLDGDRITDLMADSPQKMIRLCSMVAKHLGHTIDPVKLWRELGFEATTGVDMSSVMYRMRGQPIYEMVLGTAPDLLNDILDGHEGMSPQGEPRGPYNPRIHFKLIDQAYRAANPTHRALHTFLDDMMQVFDEVYMPGRIPKFIPGIETLRRRIVPWGEFARAA